MANTLYGGQHFHTFNVLDEGVHKALAIEIDTHLPTERVIRTGQLSDWGRPPQGDLWQQP